MIKQKSRSLEEHREEDEEKHCGVKLAPAVLEVGLFPLEQSLVADLGDHLGKEGEDADDVREEGDVPQRRVILERLGRVEDHRYQRYEGECSQNLPASRPILIHAFL